MPLQSNSAAFSEEFSFAWRCVCTKSREERLAAATISELLALEVYNPVLPPSLTKKNSFSEAVFPGYIFVYCSIAEHFRHITAMRGVQGFVRYGRIFPTISDLLINEMRTGIEEFIARQKSLDTGEMVLVNSGPFAGTMAEILSHDVAAARVTVLMRFLGQSVAVRLGTNQIENKI